MTALVTATIALVATDIKRILAYSTVSHLGLMMLSLGAGGYTAAIFHLLAHGFAKALLFLGSGSVIHSTEKQEISELGGLRRVMPITTIVFAIGAASLGGIPILAGFWSKDEILAVGEQRAEPGVHRVRADYRASERAVHGAGGVRDFLRQAAPRTGTHPRIAAGYDRAADAAGGAGGGVRVHQLQLAGTFGGFGYFVFNHKPHGFEFTWWIGILSAVMAVGSFVLAYLIYEASTPLSLSIRRRLESTRQRFAPVLRVVENKYYFDEVYQWTIDRIVLVLASFIGFFDRAIVNDIAINGPADTVRWFGIKLRLHVTGHLYSYALAMTLGVVGLGIFWWLITS